MAAGIIFIYAMNKIQIICLTLFFVRVIYPQAPIELPGFPKNLDNKRSYSIGSIPVAVDLDRDGKKEVIVVTNSSNNPNIPQSNLTVTKSNGESFINFPKEYNDTLLALASGDLNQDGFLDIVLRSNGRIYAIDRYGNDLPGFPINYSDGKLNLLKSISIYDVDADGTLEIIVSQLGQLCIFDKNGNIKAGWPRFFTGRMHLTPAIADINNDGKAEIVALTFKHLTSFPYLDSAYIRIYKYNGENFSSNWPIQLDSNYGFWEGSPSIYIDKSNMDSSFILVPSLKNLNTSSALRTCITKYNISGSIKKRVFINATGYGFGTLSIGDLDQDGNLDFFGGCGLGINNYAFTNQLNLIPGWPKEGILTFYTTASIGKVKFGNELQLIYGNYYAIAGEGNVLALNKNGSNLPWSPLATSGKVQSLTMSDVNNDGSVEIIALCSIRDTTSYLAMYSIPGIPFTSANHPWPMYAHDRYRTNQYGFIPPDETVGIFPISSNVPDKFSLHQNYPNPFNPNTTIKFDLTKSDYVTLKVFDISGREVANLVGENLKAGSYQVPFNAGELSSGVYFYQLRTSSSVETKKMSLIK